jgi:large subunit ribosomal protein L9
MAQVKVILREDVRKLGNAGDLVSVKPGFARNYLLRRGKATLATEARINEIEHHRRNIADRQAKELKDLQAVKKKVEATVIEVAASAGAEGKLFGSVTMQQVAGLLAEKGLELDRRKMSVPDAIKTVGEHIVTVQLRRELAASLKVIVTSTGQAPPEEELDLSDSLGVKTEAEQAVEAVEREAARAARAKREAEDDSPPDLDDDD